MADSYLRAKYLQNPTYLAFIKSREEEIEKAMFHVRHKKDGEVGSSDVEAESAGEAAKIAEKEHGSEAIKVHEKKI